MHRRAISLLYLLTIGFFVVSLAHDAHARGMRGGGGRGGGGSRPSRPVSRPSTRPSTPRPSTRPSVSRPSTGSRLPSRSPAISQLPSRPAATRPATLPATRPSARPLPSRPSPISRPAVARPALPASFRSGTPVARRTAARTRSVTALARPLPARTPAFTNRLAHRAAHAAVVRTALRPWCSVAFSPTWWNSRRNLWLRPWHPLHYRPWWYWWGWSSWTNVSVWVENDWDEAWTYEYDENVLFEEDAVFINEEPVATAEDYIDGGRDLSAIGAPGDQDEFQWLSLGVFAMATSPDEKEPQMLIQLELAKDGRVGGTYYHIQTQNVSNVQGSLDNETQRVAFKIGETSDIVVEAGLQSLTEDDAPLWVHFDGGTRTQTWTLIRLEAPPEAAEEKAKPENATLQ